MCLNSPHKELNPLLRQRYMYKVARQIDDGLYKSRYFSDSFRFKSDNVYRKGSVVITNFSTYSFIPRQKLGIYCFDTLEAAEMWRSIHLPNTGVVLIVRPKGYCYTGGTAIGRVDELGKVHTFEQITIIREVDDEELN